jgi:hypothetical protein
MPPPRLLLNTTLAPIRAGEDADALTPPETDPPGVVQFEIEHWH